MKRKIILNLKNFRRRLQYAFPGGVRDNIMGDMYLLIKELEERPDLEQLGIEIKENYAFIEFKKSDDDYYYFNKETKCVFETSVSDWSVDEVSAIIEYLENREEK